MKTAALAAVTCMAVSGPAAAGPAFTCGGFAMLGGAQIVCSHIDPAAPAQICSFSWALMGSDEAPGVVSGSFLLPPGATNATVYTGSGYTYALSNPIILCQGRKAG